MAILSESSADEAALRILVDAVLGVRTMGIANLPLRSRGYPAVRNVLPAIIKFLHYTTDADGLVAVVDSDHSSLLPGAQKNRLEELRLLADRAVNSLGPVPTRPKVRVAIGVASPAIEAWLLCHNGSEITEAAWENGLKTHREPYSKRGLKKHLYQTEHAGLSRQTECMIEAAQTVAGTLSILERSFRTDLDNLQKTLDNGDHLPERRVRFSSHSLLFVSRLMFGAWFCSSKSTERIGAFFTGIRASDGASPPKPVLVQAGKNYFNYTYWGDYTATFLDPNDSNGLTFWTVQEYAENPPSGQAVLDGTARYGIWLSKFLRN